MKKKRKKTMADQVAELNLDLIKEMRGKIGLKQACEEIIECAIGSNGLDITNHIEMYDNIKDFLTINNWYWGGRQIYRFDDDLTSALLVQTKDDLEISSSTLNSLPIQDFFVERYVKETGSCGFFFSVSDNYIFVMEIFQNWKARSFKTPFNFGKTIAENIETATASSDTPRIKNIAKEISKLFQFVLYLAAINADIEPVTNGAVVHKTAQRTIKRQDKTEIANVGYRVGAAIRETKNVPRVVYDGEQGKGSPKSPHIRRAHFHSFWRGRGENKEIVVKWVNTILVKGGVSEVTTVHSVKDDE